jgi:hypothetical protein
MPFIRPSVDDFKSFFVRDFPYGDDGDGLEFVLGADINKALLMTAAMLNEGLATDQDNFTLLYLLLSAHNMVISLRASSQGVASQPGWLQTGKSVGSVSESFAIPQRILDNPELALLTRTGYGQEYLGLILPLLSGQMFWVPGRTLP